MLATGTHPRAVCELPDTGSCSMAVLGTRVAIMSSSRLDPYLCLFDVCESGFVLAVHYRWPRRSPGSRYRFVENCMALLTPTTVVFGDKRLDQVKSINPFTGAEGVVVDPPGRRTRPYSIASHDGVALAVSWMALNWEGMDSWAIHWYSRALGGDEWVTTRAVAFTPATLGSFGTLCFSRDGSRVVACDDVGHRLCAFRSEDGALVNSVALETPRHVVECDGEWLVAYGPWSVRGGPFLTLVSEAVDCAHGKWEAEWTRSAIWEPTHVAASAALGILVLRPLCNENGAFGRLNALHLFSTPHMLAMDRMSVARVSWITAVVVGCCFV